MSFEIRFAAYFEREVAKKAARSLSNGVGIEFRVSGSPEEVFHFTKIAGANAVKPGPAPDPEIIFTLPPPAAEAILAHPSEEVGAIGVEIAKLVVHPDAAMRVGVKLRGGFFTLFSRGYLGVLKEGGTSFAGFLASKGLSGVDSIKQIISKLKG